MWHIFVPIKLPAEPLQSLCSRDSIWWKLMWLILFWLDVKYTTVSTLNLLAIHLWSSLSTWSLCAFSLHTINKKKMNENWKAHRGVSFYQHCSSRLPWGVSSQPRGIPGPEPDGKTHKGLVQRALTSFQKSTRSSFISLAFNICFVKFCCYIFVAQQQ